MLRGNVVAKPFAESVSSAMNTTVFSVGTLPSAGDKIRCARSATTPTRRATSSSGSQ